MGDDARNRAVEPFGRVDRVGQQVAGDAGTGHFGIEPPQGHAALRHVGRNRVVLIVQRAIVEWPADAAFVDDLFGQRNGGHAAVAERNHVGHARLFDRRHHFLGLAGVHGQRFFANNHLAGLRRRNHNVVMQHVRHAHVDQVDVGPGDEFFPIELHRFPAPRGRELFQLVLLLWPSATHLQHRLVFTRKEVIDLQIGVRMRAAHEAAADDADAKRCCHY